MQQYKDLLQRVIDEGVRKPNRTGIDTIGIIGAHLRFNMEDGFPAVTLKKLFWRAAFAEMLGFLRGYSNAAQFRAIGCRVWDQNANNNEAWLKNPNRKGDDDLGNIYGVQARTWQRTKCWDDESGKNWPSDSCRTRHTDQLRKVYDHLKQGIDDRREIVTHWNPGELDEMALPPCHLLYQFGIQGDRLHLSMYQRSCDLPLGVPFNIAGYAWLLMVMARITGLRPGTFNHFMHDVHIYENQLEGVQTMLQREPFPLPALKINDGIGTLEDLETWVKPGHFELVAYNHHGPVKMDMAV